HVFSDGDVRRWHAADRLYAACRARTDAASRLVSGLAWRAGVGRWLSCRGRLRRFAGAHFRLAYHVVSWVAHRHSVDSVEQLHSGVAEIPAFTGTAPRSPRRDETVQDPNADSGMELCHRH